MLRILLFACVLFVAPGCKREYAHFQKTASENLHQPKKTSLIAHEEGANTQPDKKEEIVLMTQPEAENVVAGISEDVSLGKNQLNEKTDLFPKWLFKKKKRFLSNDRKGGIFQKQEKRGIFEKKNNKKRRDGFWHGFNERLKIGLVLLGIAVIFALLHINILAIIFGILSAFFIIRGLRKLF